MGPLLISFGVMGGVLLFSLAVALVITRHG